MLIVEGVFMSFCIMRMAKIKSKRDVVMTLQHNTRERIPVNADPEKTKKNLIYGGTTLESMSRFEGLMPEKIRSNAVMAVELVFTASPDFNGNWGGYLQSALSWGLETFGIDPEKKDIRPAINYAVHHDESTPHLHLLVVPLKDGKLNAKSFIGGSRDRMAELQNDFYEKVGKKFELERGQSRQETRARHSHHSLAAKSAELDEREKKTVEREEKIKTTADEFKRLMGMKPTDVRELQTKLDTWNKQTPAGLRVVAANIERAGCATVGELVERQKKQGYNNTIKR